MPAPTEQKRELFQRVLRMAILGLFALYVGVGALTLAHPARTYAATSSTINFQARLQSSNGSIAPDGNYDVTFHLFNSATAVGGTSTDTGCGTDTSCLWEESYTYNSGPGASDVRVHVVNGYLTVNLGSITTFTSAGLTNWNQQLWLTMDIGGTTSSGPITWDGQMSPRIQLTAVPYAFQAGELGNGTNRATLDGSGNLTLQQASIFSTSTGNLTVQAFSALALQTAAGTTSSNVTLQSGNASAGVSGNISIDNGTFTSGTPTVSVGTSNARSVTVGNTTAATTLLLQGGTGTSAALIQVGSGGTIGIANNAVAQSIAIGNTTGGSGLTLRVGTGNFSLDGVTNSTYSVGSSTTTGTITIGGTAQTGNMVIGQSTATNTITIGGSAGNTNTQTINIGNSATAGSTSNVVIGSTIAGTTTLQSSGGVKVTTLGAVTANSASFCRDTSTTTLTACDSGNTTGRPFLQGGNSFGAQANLGTNDGNSLALRTNGTSRLIIDTSATTNFTLQQASVLSTSTGNLTVQAFSALALQTAAGTTSSAVTIQSGNASAGASGNITIDNGTFTSGTPTVSIGTTSARSVSVGNTTAATTVLIQGGTGISAALIQVGSGGTVGIANNAVAQSIVIGNTTGASGITERVGTGNYSLDGVTNSTYTLGASTTTGTFTVGGTAQTGNMVLGQSTATNTISIGASAGNTFTQTINLGNSATAGSTTNLVLGSTIAGTTTLQSAGGVKITTLGAVTANSAAFCRDTSTTTLTTCDSGNTTGRPFLQGGNSFGAQANLGTNDGNSLALRTNGTSRLIIDTSATTNFTLQQASVFSTSTGSLTVQSATSLGLQTAAGATSSAITVQTGNASAGASGNITIDNGTFTSGTPTVSIGTTNARSVSIGNTTAATTTLIQGGTGISAALLQVGSGGTVGIANNAVAQSVAIGNTTGASGITQRVGTGNYSLDGVTNSTYTLGASTTTGTFTIGGTAQTGNMVLGQSTATNTISLGSSAGNTFTQTINIGTSATAGSTSNLVLGSTIAGTITLQSAGGVKLTTLGAVTANSAAFCRDTSTTTLTTCDSGNTTGRPFLQGGNSFGAQGTIGTNDGNSLAFETNNTTRLIIDTSATTLFTLQQASIIKELSAGTGTQLTIQGGAATTGTNVGGNLLLQGGAGASTGASGSVIVQSNGNNSTTAFEVLNAAGTVPVLDVDTTNQKVGVGTATPSQYLEVSHNSDSSNGLRLTNTNSGTSSYAQLEFVSDNGQQWNIGAGALAADANRLIFYDQKALQTRWTIDTAGNIGFGNAAVVPAFFIDNRGAGGYRYETTTNTTTAFLIQNASLVNVFAADTTNGKVLLGTTGASGINGQLVFNSATVGNFTASIIASGSQTATYTLTLPTALPVSTQCLQSTSGGALSFTACAGGSVTLQQAYTNSAGASPSVLMTSANKGVTLQNDNASPITGELFGVHAQTGAGLGASLFTVDNNGNTLVKTRSGNDSLTAFQVQNAAGNQLLTADTSNMRLGVDVTYASMSAPTTLTMTVLAGGSLAATTQYFYKVTAIDAAGGETTASTENNATTTGVNKKIQVDWTAITGATAYKIYRSTTTGTEVYLTNVIANTFTDDGTITIGTGGVPGSNTAYVPTNVNNAKLQLSLGGNGKPRGQLYVGGAFPTTPVGIIYTGGTSIYAVDVQGRYAYVGSNTLDSLLIYDVSVPSSPKLISSVSTGASSDPEFVSVQGQYAYVADRNGKLLIFDISNPSSATQVGTITTTPSASPEGLYVQGRYAFVAEWYTTSGLMEIYDISNPASPVEVSSTSTTLDANGVYVQGDYAYVTSFDGAKLQVFNVSNPASPTLVGTSSETTPGGDGGVGIKVQGRYAYISDYGNGLDVYDVSNPASLVKLTTLSGYNSIDALDVAGNYVYSVSDGDGALRVTDISNPAKPVVLSTLAANSGSRSVKIQGRYVYTTTYDGYLRIFDMGGTYSEQLESGSVQTKTLAVDSNATIGNDLSIQGGVQVGESATIQGNLGVAGAAYLQGALSVLGGILGGATINGLSTPSAPTVTATCLSTCTTTYNYKVTALNAAGGETPASAQSSNVSNNATLDGSNYNLITWSPVAGAVNYKVYRTVGGATQGLITTTKALYYKDTSGAGATGSAPTLDTSGLLTVNGYATFKNTVNSTTAFKIQNAAGANLLTADTTNTALVLGNDVTPSALTVRGGAATGSNVSGSTITIDASNGTGTGTSGDINFRTSSGASTPVLYDANSSSDSANSNVASLTWSHTIGGGSNRLLMVSVQTFSTAISTVTYNGVAMTSLSTVTCTNEIDGDPCRLSVYYMKESSLPAAGSYNIVATPASSTKLMARGTTFSNVDQTTPFGTSSSIGQVTSQISTSVTTSSTLQLVYDTVIGQDTTASPGTNQISLGSYKAASNLQGGASYRYGNGSTVTMTWRATSGDNADNDIDARALFAVPINNVTAAATTSGVLNSQLYLKSNGNVGINNGNPQYTLDVVGNQSVKSTSSTAFQVQSAAGTYFLLADTASNKLTIHEGADNLLTIGDELYSGNFSSGWTGTTGTVCGTTNWYVPAGTPTTAQHCPDPANTTALTNTSVAITSGATYQVSFTVKGTCTLDYLTMNASLGGVTMTSFTIDDSSCSFSGDNYSYIVTAVNTNKLSFGLDDGNFAGTISGITIKQLTGTNNPVLAITDLLGQTALEVRTGPASSGNLFIGTNSGMMLSAYPNAGGQLAAYFNTGFGNNALRNNTTGIVNTAFGNGALQGNISGWYNSAFGEALGANTSGNYNSAFGISALAANKTGDDNNAFGASALENNTTGYDNNAFGLQALYSNISGTYNTAVGDFALTENTTGKENTGIGDCALCNSTTGSYNSALGSAAGIYNTTGSYNTSVGYNAGNVDSGSLFHTINNLQNATAIGAYTQVQASNSIVLGSVDTPTKVGIGITVPSNTFSVSPLEYQLGSVIRTNSSAVLAGSGTSWTSAMVGDIIVFADGTTNTVASYTSGTSITMGTTYGGTTDGSGIGYRFHKPGFQVTSAGNAYVQNSSTTAFQVRNAATTNLFAVDTSSNNANNLLANPSVESSISGNWTAKNGSGTSTLTQVSSPVYNASSSLQVVTSGTATNAGVTQSVTLSNNTDYVLSVYVNSANGFVATTGAPSFEIGFGSGGADTSCLTNQSVPKASWTRFNCSFNTGSLGASPYIYFKQTDATGRTYYIDAATLETNTNATSKWQDGKITLNGTINSPVIVSGVQDSSNAFAVQNSAGINMFTVNTSNTNLINNPGAEVNTVGWSGNTSGTVSRDVSNALTGVAAFKVVSAAFANSGANFTFSPNTLIQATTTYTLSFDARDSAGTYSTLTFGRAENGSQTDCVTTGTLNTYWLHFSCSFSVGGTIGASPYIYILPGTASKTIYVDNVTLEAGTGTAPYLTNPQAVFNSNLILNNLVGIGTSTPGARLQVANAGNTATDYTARFQSSGSVNGAGGILFDQNSTNSFKLYTAGTSGATGRLSISYITQSTGADLNADILNLQNGNVGINNTNPAASLDVNEASTATLTNIQQTLSSNAVVISTNYTANNYVPGMVWYTTDNNATKPKLGIWGQETGTGSLMMFGTSNAYGTGITNTALTIDQSGSLQVGSATTDATAQTLSLDRFNSATEPTEADGAIYYNTTMQQYRCGRDGVWENCGINPIDRGYQIEDEFVSGLLTTGNIGSLAWNLSSGGVSTLTYNTTMVPTGNRPGTFGIQTNTTSGNGSTIWLGGNSTTGTLVVNNGMVIKAAVAIGATATNVITRVGVLTETTTSASGNDGVWIETDGGAVTNNWRYCFGTGAAATCSNASIANGFTSNHTVAASTWVRIEIDVISSTSARYCFDGDCVIKTGLTIGQTNRENPAFACFNNTAAARNCYIDYYQLRSIASTAR